VINRLLGKDLSERDLFNRVLQLEQELTTGGGWQDQIGGAIGGVKLITTQKGLVPDPRIHFVPSDLVSPQFNGGQTLLYYTGLRRLAKNILKGVVGNYLDRDRSMMSTLRSVHALPPQVAEALSGKAMERFGGLIAQAWKLNKQIDPGSTTEVIDRILETVAPHLLGAKLLGAGGGGFLFMVARSQADAGAIRSILSDDPPNERARFFEYEISSEGLTVTVC
jgi:galactokinase/mevalonate kinase-like predicted kinase